MRKYKKVILGLEIKIGGGGMEIPQPDGKTAL